MNNEAAELFFALLALLCVAASVGVIILRIVARTSAPAREVLDATHETRAAWVDGSEQKKVWLKIQHFGRTKLQRVCAVIWPPAESDNAGGNKAKKAPTPDTILANLDAFLASNPAPVLVATLFDQIAARRPK